MMFCVKKLECRKYKYSFSLFELSLYLVIVAVLSSLIVGSSAIYENARIQRLIKEIYDYENAYVRFANKYGSIPGNLTYDRCIKFPEFTCRLTSKNNWTNTDTVLYDAKTSYLFSMNIRGYNGLDWQPTLLFTMRQMQSANLISSVKTPLETNIVNINYNGVPTEFNATNIGHLLSYNVIDSVLGHVYYDINAVVDINGFDRNRLNSHLAERVHNNEAVEPYYALPNINTIFWNALVIYYNSPSTLDTSNGASGVGTTALFTAPTMKKIDAKIDDGKPRQGNIIGTRIWNGVDSAETNTECCYNVASNTPENPFATNPVVAEYTTYKDKSRGCNLLYVLPDVSKYLY